MSKLFKLKEWFSISETAERLTSSLGEKIIDIDILRLGIDEHLILSLHVNYKLDVQKIELKTCSLREVLGGAPLGILPLTDEQLDAVYEHVISIGDVKKIETGCWDLPMIGAERLDVEFLYNQMKGAPTIDMYCLEGAFISDRLGGLYQIQDRFDRDYKIEIDPKDNQLKKKDEFGKYWELNDPLVYYPAGGLPEDLEIVVRRENIEKFEHYLLSENESNNDFSAEDYQKVLFLLKNLVCSKTKKWSQDSLNNELDNSFKGLSKRRLEMMWSMINKKFKT